MIKMIKLYHDKKCHEYLDINFTGSSRALCGFSVRLARRAELRRSEVYRQGAEDDHRNLCRTNQMWSEPCGLKASPSRAWLSNSEATASLHPSIHTVLDGVVDGDWRHSAAMDTGRVKKQAL
jgi:hypothetical protein